MIQCTTDWLKTKGFHMLHDCPVKFGQAQDQHGRSPALEAR